MARPRTTSDEDVLAATARALGRLGPGRLTLGAVAEETGLAPATLVQRFGSKRGLLLAFAQRAGDGARHPFEQARQDGAPPLTVLRTALTAMTADVREPEQMANHLGFLQMDIADPDFREHAAAHARTVASEIETLLREAVNTGDLAADADTGRLARSIQLAYNGGLVLWAISGEGELVDALLADIDAVLSPYVT
ncbi:TetR/AcrR family transcriptional regulator [Actinomadura fibrosa]|uniref:TetR/AcrR family transcriptional regulator n=1 Tax=Actinomadura fibrosa TaxID=111802 RepID=A0ABW2XUC9_9ACTN|nr:helix-turn-helix domain-containing protein [Actinomadura fibrosa]